MSCQCCCGPCCKNAGGSHDSGSGSSSQTSPPSPRSSCEQDVGSLNCKYGTKGVKVESGKGGLPKVVLSTAHGSLAEVYLHGGVVTSWKPADGVGDLLFVRPDNDFLGHPKPISGGIPHCFPQFGPGAIQQHGFARNVSWDISCTHGDADSAMVVLVLMPCAYTLKIWDYKFLITYKIVLWSNRLHTEIVVKNTDTRPFSFTTALHVYYRAAISGVIVRGLKGVQFLTKDKVPVKGLEKREAITFSGFYDCLYFKAPNELALENGIGSTISIANFGWTDAVLWNPYEAISSWREFVCVENAKLDPVCLQPCETWSAEQILALTSYPPCHIPLRQLH